MERQELRQCLQARGEELSLRELPDCGDRKCHKIYGEHKRPITKKKAARGPPSAQLRRVEKLILLQLPQPLLLPPPLPQRLRLLPSRRPEPGRLRPFQPRCVPSPRHGLTLGVGSACGAGPVFLDDTSRLPAAVRPDSRACAAHLPGETTSTLSTSGSRREYASTPSPVGILRT